MKFSGGVGRDSVTSWLDFGGKSGHVLDLGFLDLEQEFL